MLRSDLDRRRVGFAGRVVVALAGFHGKTAARDRRDLHVVPRDPARHPRERVPEGNRRNGRSWIPLRDQAVRKADARVHGLRAIGIEVDDRRFHPDRRLELRQVAFRSDLDAGGVQDGDKARQVGRTAEGRPLHGPAVGSRDRCERAPLVRDEVRARGESPPGPGMPGHGRGSREHQRQQNQRAQSFHHERSSRSRGVKRQPAL